MEPLEFFTSIVVLIAIPNLLCGIFLCKGIIRNGSFYIGICLLLGYIICIFFALFNNRYISDNLIGGYLLRLCVLFLMIPVFFGVFFGRGKFKKWSFWVGIFLYLTLIITWFLALQVHLL